MKPQNGRVKGDFKKRTNEFAFSFYHNLPSEQRRLQRFVDQFNATEEHWRTMAVKRCLRRLGHPRLSPKRRKLLDLINQVSTRPFPDAIGFFKRR